MHDQSVSRDLQGVTDAWIYNYYIKILDISVQIRNFGVLYDDHKMFDDT